MIAPMTNRDCAILLLLWWRRDGEIISLALSRNGESMLRGYAYYPANPAALEFVLIMSEINNLELVGFGVKT
jgi:hypothetical protein